MRKFVIGDIHGKYQQLIDILKSVDFDYQNDLLISLGDIVDRGPEPMSCIFELLKIKNLVVLRGNHDYVFQRWIISGDGDITSHEFSGHYNSNITCSGYLSLSLENKEIVEEFLINQVDYYIDEENRCFVHGGFDRNIDIKTQSRDVLIWDREMIKEILSMQSNKSIKKINTANNFSEIYVGHTPTISFYQNNKGVISCGGVNIMTKPINILNFWNMDTGAGFDSGYLSIMNIETKEILKIKINKDYE